MADVLPPPRIDLLVYSPTPDPLLPVLSTLLEPSAPLRSLLVPALHAKLVELRSASPPALPKTYEGLLALAAAIVTSWDLQDQAAFLSAHPRIGETKALSALSGKEQGGATPGEVLRRLSTLNSVYEDTFPGLRYTTFVNGRTRAQIVPEIEGILGLILPPPSPSTPEPSLSSLKQRLAVQPMGSQAWRAELTRGLQALWDIANARMAAIQSQ